MNMKLYDYLCKNGYVEDAEKEVVLYGTEMLSIIFISMIVIAIIAFTLRMIWETALFLFIAIPLRQHAGGYHMNSKMVCTCASSFVLAGVLLIIKYTCISENVMILMELTSVFVIMILSPVDNEKNRLNDKEKKLLYNKTRNILFIDSLIFILLYVCKLYYWCGIVTLATCTAAFMVLVGYIVNRIQMKGNISEI